MSGTKLCIFSSRYDQQELKMFDNEKSAYIAIRDEESVDLEDSASNAQVGTHSCGSRTASPMTTVVSLLITASIAFILGLFMARFSQDLDSICTRHVSKYSPIMDEVDITYKAVQFDGRFVQKNIFRDEKDLDKVDEAWRSLGIEYAPVLLPDHLAAKAGITKNHTRRNPKYGGGYPVFVEGLHQLHCLNLVRKSLFYNYEHYKAQGETAFADSDQVLHWHISHCLDIIRQELMCNVNIGVFGSVWVNRTDPHAFTDFNTKHTCRNFDDIRAWAEQNQMEEDHLPDDWYEVPDDDVYIWESSP